MQEITVLHVDDDELEREKIKIELARPQSCCRIKLESFASPQDYLQRVSGPVAFDIGLIDLHFGFKDEGYELLNATRKVHPEAVLVCYSNDLEALQRCLQSGADDFIYKRAKSDELALRLYNTWVLAQHHRNAASEGVYPKVVGKTMHSVADRIERIVNSAARCIHVHGETGTGKEMVASLLHKTLPASTPFISVNCGAISSQLMESELFGHVKGAFTGAHSDKRGLFELAHKGWVFLDELGSLSEKAQVALLRLIENQELARVGDHRKRDVDVKIISATNVPISSLVDKGVFRNDLWQRLREVVIELPPLRDRASEIEEFIYHFCKTEDGGPYEIAPEAVSVLKGVNWSFSNIRGIRNCIRAMTENHVNKLLTPLSLPSWVLGENDAAINSSNTSLEIPLPEGDFPNFTFLESQLLIRCLRYLANNTNCRSQRQAATVLGMAKSTLTSRIKRLVDEQLITQEEIAKLFKS